MKLRSEKEIIASWGSCDKDPVISICCITFNHESYIEDALKGFLNQITDFPIEILVHDDASKDSTAQIIQDYQRKYPNLIKPILQVENQFSKGLLMNESFNFPRARGEYIAFCEGDDYWTDPKKLQMQKSFLEKNLDYSFCFHKVSELDATVQFDAYSAYTKLSKTTVYSKDVILNHYIPTLSLVFRKKSLDEFLPHLKGGFVSGDIFIEVLLSSRGKGFFFKSEMGVYRHHDGGLTKGKKDAAKVIRSAKSYILLYDALLLLMPNSSKAYLKIMKVQRAYLPLIRLGFIRRDLVLLFKYAAIATAESPFWFYYAMKRKVKGYL
jgi:glycosyltransferase involved in cell wall biosynthesis